MDWSSIFYNNWQNLVRTMIIAVLAYAAIIALLRISGKRTLSKMNAFDLVVTVALGSMLATILLSKDVALAEGVLALSLLIGLQFVITWLSVRSRRFKQFIKAEPTLLLYRGQLLRDAMRRERVTEGELYAAIREQGGAAIEEIEAVVLESDASLTVVKSPAKGDPTALANVAGWPAKSVAS